MHQIYTGGLTCTEASRLHALARKRCSLGSGDTPSRLPIYMQQWKKKRGKKKGGKVIFILLLALIRHLRSRCELISGHSLFDFFLFTT